MRLQNFYFTVFFGNQDGEIVQLFNVFFYSVHQERNTNLLSYLLDKNDLAKLLYLREYGFIKKPLKIYI